MVSETEFRSRNDSRPLFERELEDMRRIVVDHVRECHDWYQRHKRPSRRLFRGAGVMVIVLSALIPLLSSYQAVGFRLTVGIIGVVIACITGLNTFYRWERSWRSYSIAQFNLDYFLRRWELKAGEARTCDDEGQALRIVRAATQELLDEARRVESEETTEFFHNVSGPKK